MDWRGVQRLASMEDLENENRATGICLSTTDLTDDEYVDIRRCFQRANRRVEGYLDSMELKVYMDLRRCPITPWEAEKLVEHADPHYQYYITLAQIIELATLYGIGTSRPARMTRSEFETAIRNAFNNETPPRQISSANISVLDEDDSRANLANYDFDGVMNYFEQQTSNNELYNEEIESDEESLVESLLEFEEYMPRKSILTKRDFENTSTITRRLPSIERHDQVTTQSAVNLVEIQTQTEPEISSLKSASKGRTDVIGSSRNSVNEFVASVDDQSIPFNTLRVSWEQKLQDIQEQNESQERNSLSVVKKNSPRSRPQIQSLQKHLRERSKSPSYQSQERKVETCTIATQVSPSDLKHAVSKSREFSKFKTELDKTLHNQMVKSRTKPKSAKSTQVSSTPKSTRPVTITPSSMRRRTPRLPPPLLPDIPGEWKSQTSIIKRVSSRRHRR